MALVLADRVQETTTTTGTGSVTLDGAVPGYQTFSSAIGDGSLTYYTIADQGGSNWEVGYGTYSSSGNTLSRDFVFSSSNSGSLVTFTAGTKSVFVTYPSEKSVTVNEFNNVELPGGISVNSFINTNNNAVVGSGTAGIYNQFQPTDGSGANILSLIDGRIYFLVGKTGSIEHDSYFDEYGNLVTNSVNQKLAVTTSSASITTLTPASEHFQILIGTTTQTYKLPDATTLQTGSSWVFDNDSTGNLTVTDNAGATLDVVPAGGYSTVFLEDNTTIGGVWNRFGMIPSEVNWGTNSLDLGGSTVITNGAWNGTTIATGYGGTGLTTFTGANNALYSTSSSSLTAGTLPVVAGGTGSSVLLSRGGVIYAAATGLMTSTSAGTTGQILQSNGLSAPSWVTPSGATLDDAYFLSFMMG
jgi:hypothetical protein